MSNVVIGILSRKRGNDTEYFLVSSTKDFGEFSGAYYPPGGHIEEGEDEASALVREMKEELGIEVFPIRRIAETSGDVKDQVTYWWACDVVGDTFVVDSKEIANSGWFTMQEMKALHLWPATENFFDEYIFTT